MFRLIIFLGFIILASCSGLKDVTKFNKADVVLSLKKGACFGKCSVYNLDVYKNGYVVYEGIMNVEKYGLYARKISKKELEGLKAAFDQDNFFGFDDIYPVHMTDLPTITMAYNKENATKVVTGSLDRPKKLLELQMKMETLIKSPDFKLVKAYQSKSTNEDEPEKSKETTNNTIDSQIIIELNSNVFMAQWLRKYSQYDVQLYNRVAPDLNYWVVTFNKQKIAPEDLLKLIIADTQVKFAEFNKKTSTR